MNSLACVVGKDCEGPTQNHHVRSRGAGGIASDIVPVCHKHHRQTHDGNALVTRDYLEYAAGMTELAWLAASAPVKGAADV